MNVTTGVASSGASGVIMSFLQAGYIIYHMVGMLRWWLVIPKKGIEEILLSNQGHQVPCSVSMLDMPSC